jgi:putative ABC transport system permease protein
LLTAFAIVVGGAMLGGTLIYGDSARAAFFDDLARSAVGVDVSAVPRPHPELTGQAALDAVARVPGVAHVEGRTVTHMGMLDRRGRIITNGTSPGFAISLPTWSGFSMVRLVDGALPARAGQAVLDQPTAAREEVAIGDSIRVLDPAGAPHALTVVGLIDLGTTPEFADFSVVGLGAPDLATLTNPPGYAQIVVAATPGTDEAHLRDQVAAALGPGYEVRTGTDLRHDVAVTAGKYVNGFQATLTATSLVALVVAGLVVYNTFQIVVSQRTREHALLRCAGARRGDIVRLVSAEAGILGLVASGCSIAISLLAGKVLLVGQSTIGRGLPAYHLTVSPTSLLIPLAAGLTVTLASALLPAFVAGRVSPLSALQSATSLVPPPEGRAKRILVPLVGGLLTLAGLALFVTGRGRGFDGLNRMVGGAMLVFVAVVVLLPSVITWLTQPLRALLGRAFGMVGRLAMDNAGRHPVRFAAAVTALMVGIAPLSTFAVILTTAQVQAGRELAENFPVDFVLTHPDSRTGRVPISDAQVSKLRTIPQLGGVTLSRVIYTIVNGTSAQVGAVEPGSLGTRVQPEVLEGELEGLPPGTVAMHNAFAAGHGLVLGDTVKLGDQGTTWSARLVATFDDSAIPGVVLANWSDFTQNLAGDDYVLISRAPGVPAATAAAALDEAVADDPIAVVSSTAQRRDSLADSLGRRLAQFDVLLGVSMVVALLGIANTLALSVVERRRESATLRALGLTRRQLRGMLLAEAVLVAIVGAVIGVIFGIGFGWISADQLIFAYGHGAPTIPIGRIATYVGIAALAGILASLLPARAATRRSLVDALRDE